MGLRSRMASPDQTWAAETRANERVNGMVEQAEHRCGVCYGPYGKSSIRCRNEPGGW